MHQPICHSHRWLQRCKEVGSRLHHSMTNVERVLEDSFTTCYGQFVPISSPLISRELLWQWLILCSGGHVIHRLPFSANLVSDCFVYFTTPKFLLQPWLMRSLGRSVKHLTCKQASHLNNNEGNALIKQR